MGLIRILMFAGIALLAVLIFKRLTGSSRREVGDSMEDERLGRLVQDPQCLVYVDSKEAVRRKVPDGELFFCSEACADTYIENARQGG